MTKCHLGLADVAARPPACTRMPRQKIGDHSVGRFRVESELEERLPKGRIARRLPVEVNQLPHALVARAGQAE